MARYITKRQLVCVVGVVLWLRFESLQIAVSPLSLVDSSACVHHHPEHPYQRLRY